MQYNVDKCEVIHFGGKNGKADYYLYGVKLGKGEGTTRPGCPCTSVTESPHAGTAGSEESQWHVGLHCESA